MSSIISKATILSVGLTCKAFLNSPLCGSLSVSGLEHLTNALDAPVDESERSQGRSRGVITVANHISSLDDPLIWGILPTRYYIHPYKMRWSLGAADICFTNPAFSAFFRNGHVLETFRGNGIFQPAVDSAIDKLNAGGWVHLFGEGKVNQPAKHANSGEAHALKLLRFKWGVGRIVMEAVQPPTIIPMWLSGFDTLMPEGRPVPNKFFPRLGTHLSITFGAPLPAAEVRAKIAGLVSDTLSTSPRPPHARTDPRDQDRDTQRREQDVEDVNAAVGESVREAKGGMGAPSRPKEERESAERARERWLGEAVPDPRTVPPRENGIRDEEALARIRSAVTAVVQSYVERLGREVEGRHRGTV